MGGAQLLFAASEQCPGNFKGEFPKCFECWQKKYLYLYLSTYIYLSIHPFITIETALILICMYFFCCFVVYKKERKLNRKRKILPSILTGNKNKYSWFWSDAVCVHWDRKGHMSAMVCGLLFSCPEMLFMKLH